MKITKIKGIAHDLTNHLDYQIWSGYYKDLQKDVVTNVIENKNENILLIQFLKKLSFYRMNKKIQKDPFGILNYTGNFLINFSYKFF